MTEKVYSLHPWHWAGSSDPQQKRKVAGAGYMDEEAASNIYQQGLNARGALALRTQFPALPPPPAQQIQYPGALMAYQDNLGYALPPFACCEASLWRGRSEGLLAAAGRAVNASHSQPIVIHNETSARLQNEVIQDVASSVELPTEPPPAKCPSLYERAFQNVWGFFYSPLNLFAVGSLGAVVIYCSVRHIYIQHKHASLRRHQMMLRRATDKPGNAAFLLSQVLLRSLSPHRRRLLNEGRNYWFHDTGDLC
eukprot:Gregarina_sp_Pseudo_9__919@NODE_158_length_3922_cov_65_175380_g145_i0_p2_GENE_NODE_158_length_3922_cov_65_175380_g145_i0NODE_158_length_3922_cov_65_175380_g145_i0_p2_ORF_typecomplete_len273_score6_90_NODE_158_length_3922_cov_65_175380_g145_i031033858